MMRKTGGTYAIAVPCAVTELKYVEEVTKGAGSGLRDHICHTPSTSAAANAMNASQRWAKVRLLACVTGHPALGVGLELARRHDTHHRRHLAVPEAAILVARHEEIAGARELGGHLAHVPRNDHRVHVRPADENAVDHIRRREAQRHMAIGRQYDAARLERELRSDDAAGNLPVGREAPAQVGFRELAAQVQRL